MKNLAIQSAIVWAAIGLLWFLFIYKNGYTNDNIEKYQKTIDSLALEIGKKDVVIASLDSSRVILDSLVGLNKVKLAETAKKAEAYRKKYNEEVTHISDMSDDSVINEFTAAFK